MAETLLENPILSTPKVKKTNLDRGFPTGFVLLSLLGIVFFTQSISAWKIMNLEHEKRVLEREKAKLDAKKDEHDRITHDLPVLIEQEGKLHSSIEKLKGQTELLSTQEISLQSDVHKLNKEKQELENENEAARYSLSDLKESFRQLKSDKDKGAAEHQQLNKESSALQTDITKFKSDIITERDKLENLRKEAHEKESNIARLEGREKGLNELLGNFKDGIAGLKTAGENLRISNQDAKTNLDLAIRSFSDAQQNVTTTRTKWDQQISEIQSASAEAKNYIQQSGDTFQASLSKASSQAHELMSQFDTEIVELRKKRSDLDALQQTLETALTKVQSAEERYATISKSIPADIKGLKEDLSSVLKQLQELKNSQRTLEKQVSDSLKKKG